MLELVDAVLDGADADELVDEDGFILADAVGAVCCLVPAPVFYTPPSHKIIVTTWIERFLSRCMPGVFLKGMLLYCVESFTEAPKKSVLI